MQHRPSHSVARALKGIAHNPNTWLDASSIRLSQQRILTAMEMQYGQWTGDWPEVPFTDLHLQLLKDQWRTQRGELKPICLSEIAGPACDLLQTFLPSPLRCQWIDSRNYQKFIPMILDLEKRVYEPARQTSELEFHKAIVKYPGFAIAVMEGETMIAMVSGGPILAFTNVAGVDRDPKSNDVKSFYVNATTVDNQYQGQALGETLKQVFQWVCLRLGVERITGRNRNILARTMLSVNYSLGARELYRVPQAYADDLSQANPALAEAIYYEIPVIWPTTLALPDWEMIQHWLPLACRYGRWQ